MESPVDSPVPLMKLLDRVNRLPDLILEWDAPFLDPLFGDRGDIPLHFVQQDVDFVLLIVPPRDGGAG